MKLLLLLLLLILIPSHPLVPKLYLGMHLSPKLCFEKRAAVVAVAKKFNFKDKGVPKCNLGTRRLLLLLLILPI